MSKGQILRRLLVTFLPHAFLFLATLLSTGVYAATMTARVALVYPVLRVFQEDVTPEMREKWGIPEGRDAVPMFTKGDGASSSALAKANRWLDRSDQYFVELFSYAGTPKEKARFGTLCTILILFLGVAAVSAISNFAHIYMRSLLIVRILISLRVRLLENLLQQPLAFYNEQKRGELISRMSSDVHAATMCLDTLTGPLLHQPLAILMPVVLLLAIKWWFAFFVAAFIAAIVYSVRKQTRKVHQRAKVRQRTVARVTETMVQMFSGIRVVKAFGLEEAKVDQYTQRNEEFARDAMATEKSKAWTRTIMELLTNLIMVLVVGVVLTVLGFGGRLEPGIVLMLLLFIAQIYRPAKILTRAFADLQDSLAGAGRVFEFTHLMPDITDKPGAIPLSDVVGTVRYEDVCFAYNGNGRVLDHVNLEVPAGQVVALVGPSGAGKSTLVNLVPRFYDPDEGRITIDGTDTREFTRASLLQNIAVVTQEPFLFNTSIRENIAYGKSGAGIDEIVAAAEAANIHDFILTLPRGYDTVVGERGANISGGQCQRITIARALIRDPKILILDEATSSLDTESERAVQQALQNLMQGRTTLVIAHRLSTVQHADKICVMQDGRICEVGSHAQLMASETLYRRLYKLQFATD
ncbi:MAG: ABC transporter ATP-binding protein [Planctomycetota bacterium]|jgi:subfamily B ATP-binding cassette protein MsbA